MKLHILQSALKDLEQGADFYSRHGEGLDEYFIESLSADIDSLRLFAGIHAQVFGYHRMLATRFPFAIYYRIKMDQIFVLAVLDCRRDPYRIRRNLKERKGNV